jgi:hypothetical protein
MVPPSPPQSLDGEGGSAGSGIGDRKISVSLRSVTVRDVLDHLCLAADLKIWIVAYPPERTQTAEGFFRTAALYSDQSLDDQYQPTWTFLPWLRESSAKYRLLLAAMPQHQTAGRTWRGRLILATVFGKLS